MEQGTLGAARNQDGVTWAAFVGAVEAAIIASVSPSSIEMMLAGGRASAGKKITE